MFDFLIFYFLYVSLVCFLIYIYQGWRSWIQSDWWKTLNSVWGLMVIGVFAETRNGFECFCKLQHFCFLDLSKEYLCSILVFGNTCFNIIVRINHDNVASRGAVGRTHIIVRLQTWNRRKDHGTDNFGGFVYVLDGFPQRDFVLWVFMYPINIFLFYGYHAEGYHAPSLPPRAITPVYASRLSRHSIYLFLGYHT